MHFAPLPVIAAPRRALLAGALALALAASGAAAGSAEAAFSASFTSPGPLTVQGDSASDKLRVFRDAGGAILFDVGQDGTTDNILTPGSGTPTVANVTAIVITGAGGDDSLRFDEANGALPRGDVDGGSGNDLIESGSGNDAVSGGEDDDTILTKGGMDETFGDDGNDKITPGDADDTAHGGPGQDEIVWNPGDDTDVAEGDGDRDTVTINSGNGAETFAVSPNGQRVRLERITPAPFAIDAGSIEVGAVNANGGDDVVTGNNGLAGLIELTIAGGAGMDTLTGSDSPDRFTAIATDLVAGDTVDGRGGNDTFAWTGDVTAERYDVTVDPTRVFAARNGGFAVPLTAVETVAIDAGGENDTVTGVDALAGRASLDLSLGEGNDSVLGGGAADRIAGGPGDDELLGRGGDDDIAGEAGTDTLSGGAGADRISCGGVGDTLVTDAEDTIAADCFPAPVDQPQNPSPGGGQQPGGGPGPTGDAPLPAGFRGFSRPSVKGSLGALSVTIVNTHSKPITVKVAATESKIRFKTVTRTIAAGAKVTLKLATPKKLRSSLTKKLRKRSRVTRKPRVTVTNSATGGKSTVTAKLTLRRTR